mmetsp:Transcript_8138/g.32530  ORF Transcript_8138/g.32530 Transcript_8138/m.32530 type:complete len:206 (+) Transcript_8138:23-640(+)
MLLFQCLRRATLRCANNNLCDRACPCDRAGTASASRGRVCVLASRRGRGICRDRIYRRRNDHDFGRRICRRVCRDWANDRVFYPRAAVEAPARARRVRPLPQRRASAAAAARRDRRAAASAAASAASLYARVRDDHHTFDRDRAPRRFHVLTPHACDRRRRRDGEATTLYSCAHARRPRSPFDLRCDDHPCPCTPRACRPRARTR